MVSRIAASLQMYVLGTKLRFVMIKPEAGTLADSRVDWSEVD